MGSEVGTPGFAFFGALPHAEWMRDDEPATAVQVPTVFIVDDDPGILKLFERLLSSKGMRTEAYADADAFLSSYLEQDEHEAECLLLDFKLPRLSGLELQRRLAQREEVLPVVMITGHGSAATAVEAMKLGAVDFIEKPFHIDDVLASIECALLRGRCARRERDHVSKNRARFARLTPREREVLDFVVAGHSSREVASILGLSKKTIDLHRSHIMAKVRADSVVDLVTMVLTGQPSRHAREGEEQGAVEGLEPTSPPSGGLG